MFVSYKVELTFDIAKNYWKENFLEMEKFKKIQMILQENFLKKN